MILALTSSGDLTTDYVIRAVEQTGNEILRLNTNDLLAEWRLYFDVESLLLRSGLRELRPERVKAVYYRRAFPPNPTAEADPASWMFISREARVAQQALYASLRCPWLSHHAAIRAAENKPKQLVLARQLGLRVPKTLLTNDPQIAKEFILENVPVVTKPLSYGDLGGGSVVHTNLLTAWDDAWQPEIGLLPTLFQEYVDKRSDVRVTVVSNKAYACRIYSQDEPRYSVDMRRGLGDEGMRHELFDLPESVQQQCIALVAALGLKFAAIDLAEDETGAFWFLEANPNGQWAWIQDRTGAPIADAIARELTTDA